MADEKKELNWWQPAVAVFAEVTGWIVVPIIIALYLGNYLDARNGTTNFYFLLCIGAAFLITSCGIGMVAMKYIRQVEASNKKSNDRNTSRKAS